MLTQSLSQYLDNCVHWLKKKQQSYISSYTNTSGVMQSTKKQYLLYNKYRVLEVTQDNYCLNSKYVNFPNQIKACINASVKGMDQ